MSLDEEKPGIFTFMVGMIIVVMAAVWLTGLVDRRFNSTSGVGQLNRDVETAEGQLIELRRVHTNKANGLGALEPVRGDTLAAYQSVCSRLESLDKDRAQLIPRVVHFRDSIEELEDEFKDYRRSYRESVWMAAAGDEMEVLRTRVGREYHNVVIGRVSDAGVEFRHANGVVRVAPEDVERSLQDRFRWNEEVLRKYSAGE